MLRKLPRLLKLFVLYGFLFLTFGSLLEATHQAPAGTAAPVALAVSGSGTPEQLIISRLGMKVQIVPGTYDPASRAWTLTDTDVQYAGMTALPNDHTGNTLLYGHNTDKVLAPTKDLVKGDIARVVTKDGRTFTYAYRSERLVDPSDTSVLKEITVKPQLTLLTCDGLWDEKRRLMTFDFVGVE